MPGAPMAYQNHYKRMLKTSRGLRGELNQRDAYFERGYQAAYLILEYAEKTGVKVDLIGDDIVLGGLATLPEFRRQVSDFADHIRLFIMNNGAPPHGVTILNRPNEFELTNRRRMVEALRVTGVTNP